MNKKYSINENFFDTITKDSAYVLGWIITDGCIQYIPNKKYAIRLQIKDKEILERINHLMDGTYEIKQDKRDKLWLLIINSKKLVKRLLDLGITPNKSKTMTVPEEIPTEYMPDFIRGVFDGNGSVYITGKGKRIESYICSASRPFIEQIGQTLKNELCTVPKIYTESEKNEMATCDLYKLRMGGKECHAFYRYIYKDCGENYLERKKKVFEEAQEIKIATGLINCKRCGKEVVKTTNKLLYCPDCRKALIKERDKIRHKIKREKETPLGKEVPCIICGKPIIKDTSSRRYCSECAGLSRKEKKMYRIAKA